jgi:hypothetical protein
MRVTKLEQLSCIESARRWCREEGHLRTLAAQPRLGDPERRTLLREAEAADRQAKAWLEGASNGRFYASS